MARTLDAFLFDILAWTGSAVETRRVSTHSLTTSPTDTPANTYYNGSVKDPGSIKRSVFEGTATSGRASVDVGFVELMNPDGRFDAWFNYGWGRSITVKQATISSVAAMASGGQVAIATTLLKATVIGIETSDSPRTLRLRVRGRMAELNKPLLTTRYLGTTVSGDSSDLAEGDNDLKDQIKPVVFGRALNVQGKAVNKFQLFYQFAANGCNSLTVYDGGILLANAGNVTDLASLRDIDVVPGEYRTCLGQGIVKLGAAPAFMVTADVVQGASVIDRSASAICQQILALIPTIASEDIDTASFNGFHAFNPAEIGIMIDNDATAVTLISQVADSVGGAILDTALGKFQAVWIAEPNSTVAATLTLRELLEGVSLQAFVGPSSEGNGVPAWRVIVNYGRIWQVQDSGSLAPRIAEAIDGADAARKQFLATATRQAIASDATVQTAHPLAAELTFDTLLTRQADAEAEAARRLALYKVRRDRISFPTFWDRGNIELGSSVKVQMDGFGYEGGKNFLVLGREDDFKTKRRTLSLWG